jgi:hypothetical protein
MRTKRILVAILSLAVVGLSAQPSFAWLLHRCCGCKYSTVICCQPYNAFTPVCFGNITGLGCCPIAMSCCQQGGPSLPYGAGCDGQCDASYSGPSTPVPGNFTPPPPTPMKGAVSYWWNQPQTYAMAPQAMLPQAMVPQAMVPPYSVQQTSYYPAYNPGYYWPTAPAPMPNYWYGR